MLENLISRDSEAAGGLAFQVSVERGGRRRGHQTMLRSAPRRTKTTNCNPGEGWEGHWGLERGCPVLRPGREGPAWSWESQG